MNEELLKILEGILDGNSTTSLRNVPVKDAQNTIITLLAGNEKNMTSNPANRLEYASLLSELTTDLPDFFISGGDSYDMSAEETMAEINKYSEYVNLVTNRIDTKAAETSDNQLLGEMLKTIRETLNNAVKSANKIFEEYGLYLSKVNEAQVSCDHFKHSMDTELQKPIQVHDYDAEIPGLEASNDYEKTEKERWLDVKSEAYSNLTNVFKTGDVTAEMFTEANIEAMEQEAKLSPSVKELFSGRIELPSSDTAISQLFDYYDSITAEKEKDKTSMWNNTIDFMKKYDVSLDANSYGRDAEKIIYNRASYEDSTAERLRSVFDYGRNKDIIITNKMLDSVIDYYKQDEQRNIKNMETVQRFRAVLNELAPVVKISECTTKKQILTVNAEKKYSFQIREGYESSLNNCRMILMKSLSDLNRKTKEIWDEYENDIRNANDSYKSAYADEEQKAKAVYEKKIAQIDLNSENAVDVMVDKLLRELDGTHKIGSNSTEYDAFRNALKEAPMSDSYENLIATANTYIAAKTANGNTPSSSSGKTRLRAAQDIIDFIRQQQREKDSLKALAQNEMTQELQNVPGKVPDELQVTRPKKAVSGSVVPDANNTALPRLVKSFEQILPNTDSLNKAKQLFTYVKLPDSVKYNAPSLDEVKAERDAIKQEEERVRKEAEAKKQAEEELILNEHREREEARRLAALDPLEEREKARKAEEISVYGIDLNTRAHRRAEYLKTGTSAGGYLVETLWNAIELNGNNTDRIPGTHRGHISYLNKNVRDMRNEFMPSVIARFLFNEYKADAETSLKATEKIVDIVDDYITGDPNHNDLGKIYTVIRNELFLPKDGKPAIIPGYDGVDRYDVIIETINEYISDYRRMHSNTPCAPGKTPRETDEIDLTNKIVQRYNKVINSGVLTADNAKMLVDIAKNPESTNYQRELLLFINDKDLINAQKMSKTPDSFKRVFTKFLAANERPSFRKDTNGADKKWIKDFIDYVDRSKKMSASNPQLDNSIRKAMGIEK